MSLKDYAAKHDKFELDKSSMRKVSDFPCFYCQYREGRADSYPCAKCGHNALADFDDESEVNDDTDL